LHAELLEEEFLGLDRNKRVEMDWGRKQINKWTVKGIRHKYFKSMANPLVIKIRMKRGGRRDASRKVFIPLESECKNRQARGKFLKPEEEEVLSIKHG
jgi:hypothetical protein